METIEKHLRETHDLIYFLVSYSVPVTFKYQVWFPIYMHVTSITVKINLTLFCFKGNFSYTGEVIVSGLYKHCTQGEKFVHALLQLLNSLFH